MLNRFVFSLSLLLNAFNIAIPNVNDSTTINIDPVNWMKNLPNDLLITNISIPGTHNSCTYRTSLSMSKCQTYTIQEQLNQGVRYLDIRCILQNNQLNIYHGMDNLKLPLDSCLVWVRDFLKTHPSEVILLRLQREKKKGKATDEMYYQAITSAFKKNELVMYNGYSLSDKKLGNCRGKAIIIEYNNMYTIPQSTDSYQLLTGFSYWGYLSSKEQIEAKWEDILKKETPQADSLKFNRINLTSSGGRKILGITIPNPKTFTTQLVKDKYRDITLLLSNSPHHFIIIVDFEELYTGVPGEFYKQIISKNFNILPT